MKPLFSAVAVALGVALAGSGAYAQTGTTPSATSPTTGAGQANSAGQTNPNARDTNNTRAQTQSSLTEEDQTFLENAIQGSYAEIEGSQLALEKGESQDVKAFAQMMLEDHGKMLKEAETLASNKGMTPPTGPSAMQVTEITALRALSGGAFDAMYVNRIGVASHEATVEMFEQASREAADPEVKAMATKTLPKLREHLEAARALDKKQDQQ